MKRFYQNETDIPAAYKDMYENRDGGWHLKPIEGLVGKEVVDEFRTKNINTDKELRETKEKLRPFEEGKVDLAKYTELLGKERDLSEGALYKKGELDAIIADRTKGLKEEFERERASQRTALETTARDRDAAQGRLSKLVIDGAIIATARESKLRPGLEDVILALAAKHWRMVDGKPQAVDEEGKPAYSNKTGLDLTMKEWVEDLATKKPVLFEDSKGSGGEPGSGGQGSGGGSQGSGGGVPGFNPWEDKTFNRTEQMKLTAKNPGLAKQMCEKAGKKWVPPTTPTGKAAAGGAS